MDNLPEDLIFSIFLYCQKTHDVSTLLLLNRHWLGVARFEAMWRMRFAFHLNDRIRSEEERLTDNPQGLATSRSKGSIRKLKSLSKSHIDEAEKLYTREKVCEQLDSDREKGVDFYTGFRFYSIFKKEVEGQRIGKMTEKLYELMACNYEKVYHDVSEDNILTDENPMRKKWKTFIEFVDSKLVPNSEDMAVDQYYMLQKNCSAQFAIKFEVDLSSMIKKAKKVFRLSKTTQEQIENDFPLIISNIIEPIGILTDPSKYKYPIDPYKCLLVAISSMNFDLVKLLLNHIKVDRKRPEEERQYREISLKKGEVKEFAQRAVTSLFNISYPVADIMYFLSNIIEIFPELLDELKMKNPKYSKFKCDEDFLANSLIDTKHNYYSYMELSMELFEKAIRDWDYPTDGSNFIAKIFYCISNVCRVSDYTASLRRDTMDTNKIIHLIELYEDVSGQKCDDELAYICATYTSNIELCKYFTDVRGLSLEKAIPHGQHPLPYSYLCNSYSSTTEVFFGMLEFLVDRLDNFYDYGVADQILNDPLQRVLYTINWQGFDYKEVAFRVLRKMLEKRPNLAHQINGLSALDIITQLDSPHIQEAAKIIEEYQKKWQDQ